ncbi:MAG: SCO family protein [Myxococcales bacterium]|nr:SCO family protein [Myxococcales bacterium]
MSTPRLSRPLCVLALLLPLGLAAVVSGCDGHARALPTLSRVPDLSLTDQRGEAFHARQLDGSVWVADFIFTRCTSICPLLTTQMSNLQRRFASYGDKLRFVSISVDPAYDTPAILASYAKDRGANTDNWSFLTGDRDAIEHLLVDGFKVRMGTRQKDADGNDVDINHSGHFVLVDRTRHIRGYYADDADGIARLRRDLKALLDAS